MGVRIQFEKGWTRYQGKRVACIDVSQPPVKAGEAAAEAVGF